MLHTEAMRELARQRHETYQQDAERARRARELKASSREEKRDRFDVRQLRWLLLRPSGA
jgi:hypothetical protein